MQAKKDPAEAEAKSKEKEPGPQIVLLHCKTDVEIISRKIDPETGYLKDKKRILHPGRHLREAHRPVLHRPRAPGQVFLYSTKDKDKGKDDDPAGDARRPPNRRPSSR